MLAALLFFVQAPVVTMREFPYPASKPVSQALFAEQVEIVGEEQEWAYIQTPDAYRGWVPGESLVARESLYHTSIKVSRMMAHLYRQADTEYGPLMTLTFGACLQELERDSRWVKVALPHGEEAFIQVGDVAPLPVLHDKKELVAFSQRFLGLPYTWGGRSSMGYDCSGFVQMLYRQIEIALKRDAKDQVQDSRFQSIAVAELEAGDLIFFGKTPDSAQHVGLYIGDDCFIHATVRENQPWIRMSSFHDEEWSGAFSATYPYRHARQLKAQ